MSTFICSDPHFGHENMINRHRKQFKDVLEHNEAIVSNWNKVVSKRDKIYILGDITMESRKDLHWISQLNGFKVFRITSYNVCYTKLLRAKG